MWWWRRQSQCVKWCLHTASEMRPLTVRRRTTFVGVLILAGKLIIKPGWLIRHMYCYVPRGAAFCFCHPVSNFILSSADHLHTSGLAFGVHPCEFGLWGLQCEHLHLHMPLAAQNNWFLSPSLVAALFESRASRARAFHFHQSSFQFTGGLQAMSVRYNHHLS